MTVEELRQIEIEYLRDHLEEYVETYCHIEDKDAEELIQPFILWDAQKEALQDIHNFRLNVILKARQLGFSWLVMSYASYVLLCWTGRTVIGLSRTEDEAKELVRRLGVIFRYMPELIAESGSEPDGWKGPVFKATALELSITFQNGPVSLFKAFPSSPNAARSFTADLLIFDEWAFQQYAREIWTSAFPVINRPMGGKVIGLSTIERGSLFEELFTDPDNGFNKIFIPWYADPRRTQEWYENTKRSLKEKITQEYPATIEEALEVPGGAFFPEVTGKTHITTMFPEGSVRNYVCIDYGLDMLSAHWVALDENNIATVYREYDAPDKTIGQAADILLSLSKDEDIDLWLAPPDLWNRDQITGKSRAIHFQEYGVPLTKTLNRLEDGCAAMKEWLCPDEKTGKAPLRIMDGSAPNLYRCLQKIQKDKRRPNVYAKEPHDLTHDVDSLRCFCVYWTSPAKAKATKEGVRWTWTEDMKEDYMNGNAEVKRYLIKKYGEPVW